MENEEDNEERLASYQEFTLDKLMYQLRNVYPDIEMITFNIRKEDYFKGWLWQYRETPLWHLLRMLPQLLETELNIKYKTIALRFWRFTTGDADLTIYVGLEQPSSEAEENIIKLIEHQHLPKDCQLVVKVRRA